MAEALKIGNECCWAPYLMKIIKKVKNQHFEHFLNEINFINYLTNVFLKPSNEVESEKMKNWHSLQLKQEKFLKKTDIKNLLKGLGIFPEQYFSFDLEEEENAGVNISQEFYQKNLGKDEIFIMSGDTKIKSTKDSMGIITRSFHEEKKRKANNLYNNKENHEKNRNFSDYRNLSEYRNNTILGMMQCNQENRENCKEDELELKKQKIQNLHHYKLVTDVIEKHLNNENQHPLAFIKKKFIAFYLNYYKGLMNEIVKFNDLNKRKKYLKIIYEDSMSDLQQFIRLFQETVAHYYGLYSYKAHMRQPFFFCKDNLMNFMISIIFSESDIYDFLLNLQIQQEIETETLIFDNLIKTQNWTIENFRVQSKICLKKQNFLLGIVKNNKQNTGFLTNDVLDSGCESRKSQEISKTENTTPLIEEIKKSEFRSKSLCSANFKDNIQNLSFDEVFLNLGENMIRRSHYLSIKHKKFIEEDKEPYYFAIKNLRKIENIKSPILKLKNIIKTSVLLIDAIKRFYQKHKLEQDYQVESDDILALFIYICSKAKVRNLFSQCKLTEKFLTSKIANSISGYYLITIMASLSFFAEKNIKKY